MRDMIVAVLVLAPLCAAADWTALVRADHPRLFFNRDSWPAVKARALGEEAETFRTMRARVDGLAGPKIETADHGAAAAEAAFVFLVTREPKHLALGRDHLDASIRVY